MNSVSSRIVLALAIGFSILFSTLTGPQAAAQEKGKQDPGALTAEELADRAFARFNKKLTRDFRTGVIEYERNGEIRYHVDNPDYGDYRHQHIREVPAGAAAAAATAWSNGRRVRITFNRVTLIPARGDGDNHTESFFVSQVVLP